MFPIQDQISAATKANLEANLALYADLTAKTLESFEKLINLNFTAVKTSMDESSATTRQILGAKDPQEFLSLVSAQAKPNLDKAIAYGSHFANIASSTQAEFSKATEAQIAQVSRKVSELVEEAAKSAPAGSENMVAMVKSAFGNATNGYEQFLKTSKQAADAFGANLNAAAKLPQVVVPAKS